MIQLKTAKQICEELLNREVEYFLSELLICYGTINIGQYVSNSLYSNCIYDNSLSFTQDVENKLKELGFKIKRYEEKSSYKKCITINFKNKGFTLFGFKLFKDKVIEKDTTVLEDVMLKKIKISACCGEETK
jgi:hypothetical protein